MSSCVRDRFAVNVGISVTISVTTSKFVGIWSFSVAFSTVVLSSDTTSTILLALRTTCTDSKKFVNYNHTFIQCKSWCQCVQLWQPYLSKGLDDASDQSGAKTDVRHVPVSCSQVTLPRGILYSTETYDWNYGVQLSLWPLMYPHSSIVCLVIVTESNLCWGESHRKANVALLYRQSFN